MERDTWLAFGVSLHIQTELVLPCLRHPACVAKSGPGKAPLTFWLFVFAPAVGVLCSYATALLGRLVFGRETGRQPPRQSGHHHASR